MLNHFFFFFFFLVFFSKVRVGAKEGGSHYWEMAVAITCGYGGYLLPLLAAHSSLNFVIGAGWLTFFVVEDIPESKVHGANMGPIWGRQDPGGSHVGPVNLAIWDNAFYTAGGSIPLLLMRWWCKEPGHQQPSYWISYLGIFWFQHEMG